MTKTCTACKEEKPLEDFWKHPQGVQGRFSQCKACAKAARQPGGIQYDSYTAKNARNNKIKQSSPEYQQVNKRNNLRKYNITVEEYDRMRADQNYRCATCGRHENEFSRGLNVDHDHACCPGLGSCGKCIRGLLCHGCNTALGSIQDSTTVLLAMVRYLS